MGYVGEFGGKEKGKDANKISKNLNIAFKQGPPPPNSMIDTTYTLWEKYFHSVGLIWASPRINKVVERYIYFFKKNQA